MYKSVLWADRNSVFTVLGRHYLETAGMLVDTAESALACMRQLQIGAYDILFLDDSLLWGGMDGVLGWINESLPLRDRPLVIVSGVESPESLASRTGIDAERCLQKPYRLLTVLDTIRLAERSLAAIGASRCRNAEGPYAGDVSVRIPSGPPRIGGLKQQARRPMRSTDLTVCGIKDVFNGVSDS